MKKLTIPVLLFFAVVAAGSWLWQSGAADKSLEAYVPADTVVYFGGTPDEQVTERMLDYPISAIDPVQLEQLLEEIGETPETSVPGENVLRALLLDFAAQSSSYRQLFAHYGIDLAGDSAFYTHGVFPVLRMHLADQAAFDGVWAGISSESGVEPATEVRGDVSLKRWRLTPADSADYVDLVVAQQESLATITFFSSLDSEGAEAERLGLQAPEQSLASSGEVAQLNKDQGFSGSFSGFVHLKRLAEGLLQVGDSRLSRDLAALSQRADRPNPLTADLEPVCRNEIVGLVDSVPRLVFGYQSVSAEGDSVDISMRSLLEMKSEAVTGILTSLRGHLPSHVNGDQMAGLATGIDMDALVPALTKLWSLAGEATYQCPQLQQMQQQMASTNPALLGVVTGMAQGIKGAGLSIYDLSFSQASGLPESVDFLFSIATANPELLISLFNTTAVPQSSGRLPKLPVDGAMTEVDLGFLSPGLTAQLGKQGQHLVIYSGDQAAEAVQGLAQEGLEPNGLMAMSFDYPRIADWIDTLPDSLLSQASGVNSDACMAHARIRQAVRSQPMRLHYRTDIEQGGLVGDTQMQMLPATAAELTADDLAGRYEVRDLNQNCGQPPMIGEESINADGSGSYTEFDPTGQCQTLTYAYSWEKVGGQLRFDIADGQFRDSCDEDWVELEPHAARCDLLPAEGGFDCIYTDEEGEGLYRYSRLP
ncbi:hypothetical protein [Marinobacterium mangrovicola]|uniref:Uncharacterized protein n=1 Tax=Marinobacterium mangrovicola TaxID=1476959 RepID=A0A4V2PEB9_9GAMM|nr:hypothetical protein [Marinobacterium mangrovicola]TCK08446.1 hypothetical protein CLV83_0529 [Marinobacterium mangrovicola]